MSTATGASKSQTDYENYKSGKDGLFERQRSTNSTTKEGALPVVFDDYMQGDKAEETETKHSTNNAKNNVSAASPSARNSRSPSGEKSRGSRVDGKVKDFIQIFIPESSPKRKGKEHLKLKIRHPVGKMEAKVESKINVAYPVWRLTRMSKRPK